MAEFNLGSNARGRSYMVMVLEAEKGGEGLEFHAVRHEFLLDIPEGLSVYKQRCGRVVRCGNHSNLPEGERTVRFMFSAAKFPQFAQHELGAFALFAFCGQWGGPKKITYASEPSPEEIVNASESFARTMTSRNMASLAGLQKALERLDEDEIIDEELSPKLKHRLRKALESLRAEGVAAIQSRIATKTYDEKQMEKLKHQFENLVSGVAVADGK